jgi:hypothetical protein
MLRILEQFSADRNPNAPTLYKSLAFSLVENHNDTTAREFLMTNFIQLFE